MILLFNFIYFKNSLILFIIINIFVICIFYNFYLNFYVNLYYQFNIFLVNLCIIFIHIIICLLINVFYIIKINCTKISSYI